MIIQKSLGFSHVGIITQAMGTAISGAQSGDITVLNPFISFKSIHLQINCNSIFQSFLPQ
jgi:hypothetical protein